jgi:CTP:molybdopterin cytidylyltransferase MocA
MPKRSAAELSTVGVLLAAGEGRRMGKPKALMHDPDGTSWLIRAAAALDQGGCSRIVVVLGAGAEAARELLEGVPVEVIFAPDWHTGMSASLRAGLGFLVEGEAALISLVDLPDVGPDVVSRLLNPPPSPDSLARAAYAGAPGHPVLIGRHHWAGVLRTATGDGGARTYFEDHPPLLVECGDLATGNDVDSPPTTTDSPI